MVLVPPAFKEDLKRYVTSPSELRFGHIAFLFFDCEDLWFLASLRVGQWVRAECRVPVLKQLLKAATRLVHRIVCLMTGIHIGFETRVGPGLYIGHGGKIVVHPRTVIGPTCNLSTGVVIGEAGRGENRGVPTLGARVYVGPGAKIIGKVRIGDDAAIGANAVVTKDVPPMGVAVGVPARVISFEGSGDFIVSYPDAG